MSLEQLRANLSRKRRRTPSWASLTAKYTDAPQAAAPVAAPPPNPEKAKKKSKEATEAVSGEKKKLKKAQAQARQAANAAEAEQADEDAETLGEAEAAAEEHDGHGETHGEEGEVGEEDEEAEELRWRSAAYDAHFDVEWGPAELGQRLATLKPCRWELPGLGSARAQSSAEELPTVPTELEACLRACGVLPVLRASWRRVHGAEPLADAERSLLRVLCGYRDLLCTDAAYEAHGPLLRVLALHTLQHVLVTQRMVLRHQKKGVQARDQGFTRPKALVVLPFRAQALAFMRELIALLPVEAGGEQVENKSRFVAEFDDADGGAMPASKPDDYRVLFDGNNDDCFRIGVRLQRKATKLFAPFYKADIVVASPLGLRLGIGAEGDAKKPRDADWLSSIEVAVAPYADVFTMQNWAHLKEVFATLNALPTQQRDTDFSRVRSWYLDGNARQLRQTVLLAAHPSAELSSLMRSCANTAGSVSVGRALYPGALAGTPPGLRQLFVRFDADDPSAAADARLAAFREHVLPSIVRGLSAGADGQTLLLVPSYFDFVRVRALLEEEDLPFAAISEYTEPKDVNRARTSLQQSKLPLLLYTERAHFFRRHRLRGARNLAVYAPPSNAHFYVELSQMLEQGGGGTTVVLYCRLDLMPLQRLVGSERAARMLKDDKPSFLFC